MPSQSADVSCLNATALIQPYMFKSIRVFRKKLKAGRFCLGAGVTLSDPAILECLGGCCDFFWIDLEHTPISLETLQAQLIAARAVNVPALVRVPSSEIGTIKRVLDTGAAGLIVPQVRSADEVRRVVSAARYQPLGDRGFGPRRAANYGTYATGAYIREANRDLFVCVQIENEEAVGDLDAIIKVRHLDCIVVGPYDLAASMGRMGQVNHPAVIKAVKSIVTRSRRAGLFVGMGMGADSRHALRAARLSVNWVQCGDDLAYMARCAEGLFQQIRGQV
jgi:2-keto-3-deoxy-L-rhamnonate aldolase RhmA